MPIFRATQRRWYDERKKPKGPQKLLAEKSQVQRSPTFARAAPIQVGAHHLIELKADEMSKKDTVTHLNNYETDSRMFLWTNFVPYDEQQVEGFSITKNGAKLLTVSECHIRNEPSISFSDNCTVVSLSRTHVNVWSSVLSLSP